MSNNKAAIYFCWVSGHMSGALEAQVPSFIPLVSVNECIVAFLFVCLFTSAVTCRECTTLLSILLTRMANLLYALRLNVTLALEKQ